MYFAIGIALFIGAFLNSFFLALLYFGWDLHSLCLSTAPESPYKEFYQALTCGQRLPSSSASESLKQLGIIHLFVVSGAHLHFLLFWLKPLPRIHGHSLNAIGTFTYCLICDCSSPIFRAWIQIQYSEINRAKKLWLSRHSLLLLSALTTLFFSPSEIQKYSIPLSWLASLALLSSKNIINQSLLIYLFSFPIIQSFIGLSIWSAFISILVTPLVSIALFPLSLISFLVPNLSGVTDVIWMLFEKLCSFLVQQIPQTTGDFPKLSPSQIWTYTLSLHFLTDIMSRRKRKL